MRDYIAWHRAYDDPGSDLSRRLAVVQEHIRNTLDAKAGPVHVVSACSGDGRDIIDVLAQRDDADRVQVTLLEVNDDIGEAARNRAAVAGLSGIEVRTIDAGTTDSYAGVLPADLLLLVGIFGNITDSDIRRTLLSIPQFCTTGAIVVWTRGRDDRDIGAQLRSWCIEAGCTELAYTTWPDMTAGVGAARFIGQRQPLVYGRRLFTFLR